MFQAQQVVESIILSLSVFGAPDGIASASFNISFFFNNSNNQKITKHNKEKEAKGKLDGIQTLVSQALIDMEISHEEYNATIREKQKCERNVSERQENMRLNNVNSKKITSL